MMCPVLSCSVVSVLRGFQLPRPIRPSQSKPYMTLTVYGLLIHHSLGRPFHHHGLLLAARLRVDSRYV